MGGIYPIATKLPKGHKIYQMAVIYSKWPPTILNIFIPRPSKIYPNLDFWFENLPSGNRDLKSRLKLRKTNLFPKNAFRQGCQMAYFQTKIPIWVNFRGSYNGRCWYILLPFGLFSAIWCILSIFVIGTYFVVIWYTF
jgi:hypothetical protein